MANDQIDPTDLVGERVDSVIIGWHCFESTRSVSRLFLRLANGIDVEAHTAGGALTLLRGPVPDDFSMNEYGRYEFRKAEVEEPSAATCRSDDPRRGGNQVAQLRRWISTWDRAWSGRSV